MSERRCYMDELNTLVEKNAPEEEIFGRMQELINLISGKLAVVAMEINPSDYPFVVACMEKSCENLRTLFSPDEIQLVEDLKRMTVRVDGHIVRENE